MSYVNTDVGMLSTQWPYKSLGTFNLPQVWEAVALERWQAFRKALKGTSTQDKLISLSRYLDRACEREKVGTWEELSWMERCRVQNYIGALKRGGQLKVDGTIQR